MVRTEIDPWRGPSYQESPISIFEQDVVAKLWAARFVASLLVAEGNEGSPVVNLARTGGLFYEALFQPDQLRQELYSQIDPYDLAVLSQNHLPIKAPKMPDKDQFVREFRNVMTGVPFEEATFPGAVETVQNLLEFGPARIWTVGDVRGIPTLGLPGSGEQLFKLARLGLNSLRRRSQRQDIFLEGRRARYFDVTASENKIPQLETIVADFEAHGVNTIVVIDDKVVNLRRAETTIRALNPDIPIMLVWDRESEQFGPPVDRVPKLPPNLSSEEAISQYNLIVVDSLKQVLPQIETKIRSNSCTPTGSIVDLDDVVINDVRKAECQGTAVLRWLRSREWF